MPIIYHSINVKNLSEEDNNIFILQAFLVVLVSQKPPKEGKSFLFIFMKN